MSLTLKVQKHIIIEIYICTFELEHVIVNSHVNRRVYHIVTDHAFWVESIVTYHRIYRKQCIT